MSAFAKYRDEAWPYRYAGTINVPMLIGGVPTNQKMVEGWLRSKLADKDDLIRQMVAETMVERGVNGEEAATLVAEDQHLNGFKRDEHGLYIEGRQLKAAIKEATSVAVAAGKINQKGWGKTNKGLLGFVAEHVMVVERRLHLGVTEPSGVHQRFIHTWRGNAIQYEEYVENASFEFTVIADYEFSEKDWALIWLTGEQQGIGASRSQDFGRYEVARWERER